jgi:hypothetical protein
MPSPLVPILRRQPDRGKAEQDPSNGASNVFFRHTATVQRPVQRWLRTIGRYISTKEDHTKLVTLYVWLWYSNPDGLYHCTNPLVRPYTLEG